MENFLNLEHNEKEDAKLNKTIDFCVCCYEEKSELLTLSRCNLTYIMDFLVDDKIVIGNLSICGMCHNMLRKIDKFKKEVKENYRQLREYNVSLNKAEKHSNNLQISRTTIISTISKKPLEEIIQNNSKIYIERMNIKTEKEVCMEIEVEPDVFTRDYSDSESPPHNTDLLPNMSTEFLNVSIKVEIENESEENFVSLTRFSKTDNCSVESDCLGKIKIVTLSNKDLMKERKEDRQNITFCKAQFKCTDCISVYRSEQKLRDHVEKDHTASEGGLTCTICKVALPTQSYSANHYQGHFTRYECIECGFRDRSACPVLAHYKEAHSNVILRDMSFKCDLCNFTTDTSAAYREHREEHDKMSPTMSQHFCKICTKSFVTRNGLLKHVRKVHERGPPNKNTCECGKSFRKAHKLDEHRRRHKDCSSIKCDKRLICDECGKKYVYRRDLVEHINFDHLKIFHHSCEVCSKAFRSPRYLIRHTKFVHEKMQLPKDKICTYCGRGFSMTKILRNHIRTHTGERPYHCPECPAKFAHSAGLYNHKKLVHKPDKQRNQEKK